MKYGEGRVVHKAGWLLIAASGVLLQACAGVAPSGPAARLYAVDLAGGAKSCSVPKVTPVAGKTVDVAMNAGNDGGWCAVTVTNDGRPFGAGLLAAPPAHGKVLIHTVGDATRIDYTPASGFAGADTFTVRLIPGEATLRISASVTRP